MLSFTLDIRPESKKFIKFLDLIVENHPIMRPEDSNTVLQKIKPKISPLENVEELSKLYKKCYLGRKKRRRIDIPNDHKQVKWRTCNLTLFIWIISEYSFIHQKDVDLFEESDWKFIASLFPKISWEKCRFKWYSVQKCKVQKEQWTKEEDQELSKIVKKHKEEYPNDKTIKWTKIANEINKGKVKSVYRLGRHCRERWINHLDPDFITGNWSLEEDSVLLGAIKILGKKWSLIAKHMKGRHENAVKNRYNSIIKTLTKINDKLNSDDVNEVIEAFKKNNRELNSQANIAKQVESQVNLLYPPNCDQIIETSILSPSLPPDIENLAANLDIKSFVELKIPKTHQNFEQAALEKIFELEHSEDSDSSLLILSKTKKIEELPVFEKIDNQRSTPAFPESFLLKTKPDDLKTLPDLSNFEIPNVYDKYIGESNHKYSNSVGIDYSNFILNTNQNTKGNGREPQHNHANTIGFDLSNFINYYSDSDFINTAARSNEKKSEEDKNCIILQQAMDIENLSQRMSSMSISDQLLVEATKILAALSSDHTISSVSQFTGSERNIQINLNFNRKQIEKNNTVLVQRIDQCNANNGYDIKLLLPPQNNDHLTHCKTIDEDIYYNKNIKDANLFSPFHSPGKNRYI